MEEKNKYFDDLIQKKLEQFPRAVYGDAPMDVLKKILQELTFLKEAKEAINYVRCSTELKSRDVPSFTYWLEDNEYTATKNSNILTKHKENYNRLILFEWYKEEFRL